MSDMNVDSTEIAYFRRKKNSIQLKKLQAGEDNLKGREKVIIFLRSFLLQFVNIVFVSFLNSPINISLN